MRRSYHNRVTDAVLDLLAPGPYHFFACRREAVVDTEGLCEECREQILLYPSPSCLQPLDGLFIGLQYTEPIKHAILSMKMHGNRQFAPFLAQYLSVPKEWKADILVPVPMHPARRFLRGMNHSELLTQYLSVQEDLPYSSALLLKSRYTFGQKRILDPAARRRNIRNRFTADPACKGLRIVLVDDIFTSGATVYECAKTLKCAGAARVYACCVASRKH